MHSRLCSVSGGRMSRIGLTLRHVALIPSGSYNAT